MGKGMWAQICADIGKARYAAGRRKTDTCILADLPTDQNIIQENKM